MTKDVEYDVIEDVLSEVRLRTYACTKCGKVGNSSEFSMMNTDGTGYCSLCTDMDELKIFDSEERHNVAEFYSTFDRSCAQELCEVRHCLFCPEFAKRIERDLGITVHRT